MQEERPARLSNDILEVEAGTTGETTVELGPLVASPTEETSEIVLRVRGLPRGWYTLATDRVRLSPGKQASILMVVHPPREDRTVPLGEYQYVIEVLVDDRDPILIGGRLIARPPGGQSNRSRLLQYLPAVFHDDVFLGRFLLIFQSIVDSVEQQVDTTHYYLDPSVTPASFLPWLATWVGITLESGVDALGQRALIRRAVELASWRGTRRGLREEIELRTGARVLIVENFDGMRLGQDAAIGLNTHLGVRREGSIAATLVRTGRMSVDQQDASALVQEVKPAHVGHVLRVVRAPVPIDGGGHA